MCVQLQIQTQAIQYFHAHTFSVKLRFWKSASIRNVCSDFTYSQAILKETQLSAHTGKLQHHLAVSDTLKMKYRFPFFKKFYLKGRVTERNLPCTGSLAQGTKAKDEVRNLRLYLCLLNEWQRPEWQRMALQPFSSAFFTKSDSK